MNAIQTNISFGDIIVSDYPVIYGIELLGSWYSKKVQWVQNVNGLWKLVQAGSLNYFQSIILRVAQVVLLPITVLAIILKAIYRLYTSYLIDQYRPEEQSNDVSTDCLWNGNPAVCLPNKKDNLKAIIIIGGSASGKTTIRESIFCSEPYVLIDADLYKTYIPKYLGFVEGHKMDAASTFHPISCQMQNLHFYAAMHWYKQKMVIDGTGSDWKAYQKYVFEPLRKHKYKIELIFVETGLEKCLERAKLRAEKTGRYVPEYIIRSSNESSKIGFEKLKDLADCWKKYNNDGAYPKLIDSYPKL